jgi:hypothetical protein
MKPLRTLVLGLIAGLILAAPAAGAGGNPIINDCFTHGRLTRQYSVPALRHALAVMPAEVKQYSNCYDVIQTSLANGGKPGGLGSGGGGSFLPTPVLVVLIIVVLALVTAGAIGYRRRQ